MESYSPAPVAIILVNWNGYAHTVQCLRSLGKISYPNYQVFVVDNASTDGSIPKLKEEFPDVQYILSEHNTGFTGGNNLGIKCALKEGFELVLILNNDTEVEPDFLSQLVKSKEENPKAGIIQPLIAFLDEKNKIWSAGGFFKSALGHSKTQGYQELISNSVLKTKLDWATGCCMLLSKEILEEAGSFHEAYFAYFEDVDLSLRIRKLGYEIVLAPQALIYHEAGASSKQQHSEGTLSPKVFYLTARNQLFQLRRHVGFPQALLAWPYQLGKFGLWLAYFCLRARFQKAKALIFGIIDGVSLDVFSNKRFYPR